MLVFIRLNWRYFLSAVDLVTACVHSVHSPILQVFVPYARSTSPAVFFFFTSKIANKFHSRDKLQTCVVWDKIWWLDWRKLIRNTYSYLIKNVEPVPFDPCGIFWPWRMFSPKTLQPSGRSCFISSLCRPEGKLRNTSARAAFSS